MFVNYPKLLVAMPQLDDANFARSVVLLLQHGSEGAMGFVINCPSQVTLTTFAQSQNLVCHPDLAHLPVYKGGPLQLERGWLLHRDSSLEEKQELLPKIYLSASTTSLTKLLASHDTSLKLILGYASWAPGQLEQELQQGGWLMCGVRFEYILTHGGKNLWQRVIEDLGIDPIQLSPVSGVH